MHFGGHRMGIVTGLHRALCLEDDISIVEKFVDKVYGDAAFLVAAAYHVLVHTVAVHSFAAMQRDEGRMDVHNRTRIGIDQILGHEHQVTGEHDEVNMVFVVVSLIKANRAPDGALFTRKENNVS